MKQLDPKLIESSLALTGKTMEDMNRCIYCEMVLWAKKEFSIEKFCYYLLSPEFIEKYLDTIYQYAKISKPDRMKMIARWYWDAIYEYQSGNEQPLIDLLSKIWAK